MTPVPTTDGFDAWFSRPGVSWLFKHSTTCPISAAARTEVEAYEKAHPRDDIGLLLVLENRPASERAATVLGVKHESPQIFLLRNGKVLWHASHGEVTQSAMELQRLPAM
jgi:monothiol bacilliredoxin